MSTALIPKIDNQKLIALDSAAVECRTALANAGNDISGSLVVAEAMAKMRNLITADMMASLHALQGSAVGFKTDKDKDGGYPPEQLKDPLIEATVRGFRPIGNEFNVISGRFYGCLAGFERKVKSYPGLTKYAEALDIQETTGGNAKVGAVVTWELNGKPERFTRLKQLIDGQPFDHRIIVRVNAGMGQDAILGKARRKLYAAIYDYLIQAVVSTPEGEIEGDVIPVDIGDKRVKKSSLFDDEPPADAKSESNPGVIAEYRGRIANINAKTDVSEIMREMRTDSRLSQEDKKQVTAMSNEAMKVWPKRIADVVTEQREPGEDDEPFPT